MFNIDIKSDNPIYLQIVNQTKKAILKGQLKENDRMPSVREMAKILLVNQSTVTRAYKELEDQGIIRTVGGKGTFISLDERKINWEKENMKERLEKIMRESIFYEFTEEEILKIFRKMKQEVEHGNRD